MKQTKKRDRLVVDHDFNHIMATDVKVSIATAFILLEAGLKEAANYGRFSGREISLLEKKASQMKQEVNNFIDSQKQRIIAASEAQWHNGFQVPE